MRRRDFLGAVGSAVAWAGMASASETSGVDGLAHGDPAGPNQASVHVKGDVLTIHTHTQSAVMEKGLLVSLISNQSGEEFIQDLDVKQGAALQLVYRQNEVVPIDQSKFGRVVTRKVSSLSAEILFHSWDGDGVVSVSADPLSGDILVEPSAYSSRAGVLACRWNVRGLRPDIQLVAPFFQGIKLPLADALIADTHWAWPMYWEAGLAILQAKQGGFWVHTQDSRYRYKALKVGSKGQPYQLGFDTQAYGPVENNLSAGGLAWRINVFSGDWRGPAKQYRAWLWQAYDLQAEEARRPDWIRDIKLAVSWCPGDGAVLDALAQRIRPQDCLIHFPNWRTDPYDENYPSYTASDTARDFIQKGQALGFRMMPHFNAIDMDPSHPSYAYVRDFQYRGIERQDLKGWSWYQGRGLGVPESNASRQANQDKKVMIKVHPGLSMWRSILGQQILQAAQALKLDTVFIDVTLVTHNLHNCFVEGMTASEGMKRLIRHVADLGKGLVVAGEGLNEITMQGQSFAQAHLFKSWHSSVAGLERTGGCPLNDLLFGRLCRTIGYANLGGRNEDQALRMKMHLEHGAIPTVTIRNAQEIVKPNTPVEQMLRRAAG